MGVDVVEQIGELVGLGVGQQVGQLGVDLALEKRSGHHLLDGRRHLVHQAPSSLHDHQVVSGSWQNGGRV